MQPSRKESIRQYLAARHAESMAVLEAIAEAEWARPLYSTENADWAVRDALAHLTVSEGGQLAVIERCLAGEQAISGDFDLDRFNRRSVEKSAHRSPAELLAQLKADYERVLAALEAVAEADLDKTLRHARGDSISVEHAFRRIAEHRADHAAEIAAALSPARAG